MVPQNNDGDKDIQQQLAENVNKRLENALDELKERHRTGTNEVDDPDRAPTGPAYQMIRQQQEAMRQAERIKLSEADRKQQQEAARLAQLRHQVASQLNNGDDGEDDGEDSDYDDLLDDPALDELRDLRLEQMKQAHMKKVEDIARGHGQVRTIAQDEFLPECTGTSEYVAVHFFHKEFQRCEIMDHHLKEIAVKHTECKCLRIDAEKAPFFVAKLQVRTLPTLIVFREGKAVDRLTGFEGLVDDPTRPDEWSTRRLAEWMSKTGAIDYRPTSEELREDLERMGVTAKKTVYSSRAYADGGF
eukprot:scaffold149_cov179-Amphora_coffeaeformis.AAC.11